MSLLTGLSEEQVVLRDAVRALLAKRSDSAAVRQAVTLPRGYDESLWQLLCELVDGAGDAELHLVMEDLGRTLTPSPLLGSILSARLLRALGEAAAPLGREVVATCWAGADGQWTPASAAVSFDGSSLTGRSHYVLDGDCADRLLVVAACSDDIGVFGVDPSQPGVSRTATPTMDPTRRLAAVTFDRAHGTRIGGDAQRALDEALRGVCVALSAEQVGAAERILELTVEYTKMRRQFGRPIGSFQALKHRMADLHVLVESARSASYAAADGVLEAAVAKAYCSEAFATVAAEAIQLHGGIAITWEHDAHLYFKRAHGSSHLFGSPREHIAHLAPLAGLS